MKLIFLGTNGWYSTHNNTICTLIDSENFYVIFDAGDGLHKLDMYINENKPIILFLSHTHLDHIIGFHILSKFRFKQSFNIIGYSGIKEALNNIIRHPYTSSLKNLSYKIEISEVDEGDYENPIPFSCRLLIHSDDCLGFRINLENKIITYCTDTGVCDALYELSKDADLLISECSYKKGQEEWGWPHLKPEEIAHIAHKSNVKTLILTHFDASIFPSLESRVEFGNKAIRIFKNTMTVNDGFEMNLQG
ncbi:MAG: MBL fold metallo-hydrolase [Promethearchaeota archaeon]